MLYLDNLEIGILENHWFVIIVSLLMVLVFDEIWWNIFLYLVIQRGQLELHVTCVLGLIFALDEKNYLLHSVLTRNSQCGSQATFGNLMWRNPIKMLGFILLNTQKQHHFLNTWTNIYFLCHGHYLKTCIKKWEM